jgi:hypothetical protein
MLPGFTSAGVGGAAGDCACDRAADATASTTRRDSDPSGSLIATSLRAGEVPARCALIMLVPGRP